MSQPNNITECIACDGEIEGEIISDELGDFVEWPEICPHCGEEDWSYGGEDYREDFYRGI